jgi:pyruvate dehydrogenase E2 component (dihydrolipoamide acetyltransferase)
MNKVTMPQMGYDMKEGVINAWKLKEGDQVHRGDVLASIATDKADIDIEAYADGVLRKIIGEPGKPIPVGETIAWIGDANEEVPTNTGDQAPAPQPGAQPIAPDSGQENEARIPTPPPAVVDPQPGGEGEGAEAIPSGAEEHSHISPLARKKAAELGVDINLVRGTGPGGRVVVADVEALSGQGRPTTPAPSPVVSPAANSDDPFTVEDPSRLRKAIASSMTAAKQSIPHFYVTIDINAGPLVEIRQELARSDPEQKVTLTDFIVRACARVMQSHRGLNASWIDGKVQHYQRSNIAIAVALADGLIAPTLRNCDQMSFAQHVAAQHDLVERARNNQLKEHELSGAHMAVSNLGMYGVDNFIAIITPPQSSVLAVGTVRDEMMVVNGQLMAGKKMRMTLAVDHRVNDGAQAAQALQELGRQLESPAALLV